MILGKDINISTDIFYVACMNTGEEKVFDYLREICEKTESGNKIVQCLCC